MDEIRGRVFSFDYGLVTLTIALSTLLAGLLAEALAPQLAVWAMVGLVALAGCGNSDPATTGSTPSACSVPPFARRTRRTP